MVDGCQHVPLKMIGRVLAAALCLAEPALAEIKINEFMASNVRAHANASGDYEDWIEIHNSGDSDVDLRGYYLTDKYAGNKGPEDYSSFSLGFGSTTVPAGGYLLLTSSDIGFSLKRGGEEFALLEPDGRTVVDLVSYRDQFRDVSYGLAHDAANQWVYFSRITPGEGNGPGHEGFVRPPEIMPQDGFHEIDVQVGVLPAAAGDQVRYTVDGSDPTETSPLYEGELSFDRNLIFKARAFRGTALPSEVVSRIYLQEASQRLPTMTLVIDPDSLYHPDRGIVARNLPGREWERHVEVALFTGREPAFHHGAGLRLQGRTGPVDYEKKSFRLFFRKGYGTERLDYPLFAVSGEDYSRLVLRSGYDDSLEPNGLGTPRPTLLRDPLVSELWRQCGGLSSKSRFVVLRLNDEFHGIYDVRESVDEDFILDRLNYEGVDLIRTRWDSLELVHGDRKQWDEMVEFFASRPVLSDRALEEAGRLLDIEDFTNLQALAHATQYDRWAYGTSAFRERSPDGRWQWTIWDADRAFNDFNWNSFETQINPTHVLLDSLITNRLLSNEGYRVFFVNRFADLLNTVFSQENVLALVDSLTQEIVDDIPDEVARWGNSVENWNQFVGHLRTFSVRRPGILRQQLIERFRLLGEAEVTVSTDGGSGRIKVNTLTVDQFPWTGTYLAGNPVTVVALPASGYRFAGWSDPSLPDDAAVTLDLVNDANLVATFAPVGDINVELVAPSRRMPGQHFPFVVRLRDSAWEINPIEQTPMSVEFGGARPDSVINIKRGAGTGVVAIETEGDFTLTLGNQAVPTTTKHVDTVTLPVVHHSGTLAQGEVVWDHSVDHVVDGDITVPAGTRLVVEAGAWVAVGKFLNFYVEGGEVAVEGTRENPVVITSAIWSEPWGGMEFDRGVANFRHCIVLNGGGDSSKAIPNWHTDRQHIFFGKNDAELNFDYCYVLNSPGKAFGASESRARIRNSVSSFVYHGGEFYRTLLFYQRSHLMNLPNDDGIYVEDIDTDGLHIAQLNEKYPDYSVIDRCYFVTGKDDAIDHQAARLRISNCWLEGFQHEGVAASSGDTVWIFNTVAIDNEQGFEAGYTVKGNSGPHVFIDHSVAVNNDVGLRIGDGYNWDNWTYNDRMRVTNSVIYGNGINVWNHIFLFDGPLEGALDISHTMTNDPGFDGYSDNVSGVPEFDPAFFLVEGSFGSDLGTNATAMGRLDSTALTAVSIVINEIMFRSGEEADSGDWVEFYNTGHRPVDLAGWSLWRDGDDDSFWFPSETEIGAGEFLVVAQDTAAFSALNPRVPALVGELSFGFASSDRVRLFDGNGRVVDSVSYDGSPPWSEADGSGFSVALRDPRADNALRRFWRRSLHPGGTPGRFNSSDGLSTEVVARSGDEIAGSFMVGSNYPNPFGNTTSIDFSLPDTGRIRLVVYNVLGQRVDVIDDIRPLQSGNYRINFARNGLSAGIYLYELRFVDRGGRHHRKAGKFTITR